MFFLVGYEIQILVQTIKTICNLNSIIFRLDTQIYLYHANQNQSASNFFQTNLTF